MENATAPFESTGPHGHRTRMRTRLLAAEGALADYEILEMLLFFGIPRGDTKPRAKALINQFGSLAAALVAKPETLHQTALPPRAVEALQMVRAAAAELARPDQRQRPLLDSWEAIVRHLDLPARARATPGWGALLLNNRNQLLHECAWPAAADPARLVTELVDQGLKLYATAVILLCSCGAGPPAIGAQHHAMHGALHRAAGPLGIALHDLVVIGAGRWVSLRQQTGA